MKAKLKLKINTAKWKQNRIAGKIYLVLCFASHFRPEGNTKSSPSGEIAKSMNEVQQGTIYDTLDV